MKTYLLLLLAILNFTISAETILNDYYNMPSTLSGDITLTTQLVVFQGTLTILPGTRIKCTEDAQIVILDNGKLNAIGTENDSIYLYSATDSTFWQGISIAGQYDTTKTSNQSNISYLNISGVKTTHAAIELVQSGDLTINHSKILNNFSGGISSENSILNISESVIKNNINEGRSALIAKHSKITINRCTFDSNYSVMDAAIKAYSSTIQLDSSIFSNNTVSHSRIIEIEGSSKSTINACTFINNRSRYSPSTISQTSYGADNLFTLSNNKFTNNIVTDTTQNLKYTVYINTNAKIVNNVFERNNTPNYNHDRIIDRDETWSGIVENRGVFINNGVTVTIEPGTIVKSLPQASISVAGRLIAEGTEDDSIIFTSKDSLSWNRIEEFSDNNNIFIKYARIEKAAIALSIGHLKQFTISNILFYKNDKALSLSNEFSTVNECKFEENETAINSNRDSLYISNSSIEGSKVGLKSNDSYIKTKNLIFLNNYQAIKEFGYGSKFFINESVFDSNTVSINFNYSNIIINKSTISNSQYGLYFTQFHENPHYDTNNITHTKFINNNKDFYVTSYRSKPKFIIENSLLTGKSNFSSDMYASLEVSFVNCTVTDTISYYTRSNYDTTFFEIKARNSIFSKGLFIPDTTGWKGQLHTSITNSCISDLDSNFLNIDGNIDADPLFVNEENREYQLSENSPCIDVGSTDNITEYIYDLSNNQRVINGAIDMGVYEYEAPSNIDELGYINESENITIYPNPVNKMINVTTTLKGRIVILNTNGKVVYVLNSSQDDISFLIKGIYYIGVVNDKEIVGLKSFYKK